jgi:hypothetical protein
VALLNGYGAAPVAAEVLAGPDGEEKADDGKSSSNPKGPDPRRPELAVEPGQRDASCREEDDHDQEGEGSQDARRGRLEALGGFGIDGLDLPIEKKGDPHHGKERFKEPEHSGPPGVVVVLKLFAVFTRASKGEFSVRWIRKSTQADADIRSFVEHIGLAIQDLLCRLDGQKQWSVLLADRSIHAHLSKCTVNFFCSHIAFDRIKHSRKVSQCGSVIALFKSIGGDARKAPIL